MDNQIAKDAALVGRLLEETDDSLILQVPKSLKYVFDLENGQPLEFFTILFVRDYEGSLEPYNPAEARS